jgi:alpha-L-fucosidase
MNVADLPKADTSWFVKDRFGLFLHWGLYSLGARHEWLMNREKIDPVEYRKRYFGRFDPDLYDPKLWAKAAADAGMKYFVITAKHHEGFCLWDSAYTDFKATNTPAKRDVLKPMVNAFREQGIRAGLYYSLLDWSHPDFTIDFMHPLAGHPDRAAREQGRDIKKYAQYMRDQVKELLTNYGDIDLLWFDFSYPKRGHPTITDGKGRDHWESEELIQIIRKLRPNIMVDDRLDLPGVGDMMTPEQFQPRTWVQRDNKKVVWEACQTMSGSWGYHRDEATWRSADQLIRTLIDSVSKGGNLLLNVGPTSRGEFDHRALSRLTDIGTWMRRHSRSIYGCTAAPEGIPTPENCLLTWNPETKRLYVHILAWPYKHIHLDGLFGRVEYAQLLHDGSEVAMKGVDDWQLEAAKHAGFRADTLTVTLPQQEPVNVSVPVIELFLKD